MYKGIRCCRLWETVTLTVFGIDMYGHSEHSIHGHSRRSTCCTSALAVVFARHCSAGEDDSADAAPAPARCHGHGDWHFLRNRRRGRRHRPALSSLHRILCSALLSVWVLVQMRFWRSSVAFVFFTDLRLCVAGLVKFDAFGLRFAVRRPVAE